uniref:DM domain-containing protein n=1 Tax=Panagrolaimus sp. ES5 TaxID=591445 RepID=A0AC34F988_9BILA
MMVSIDSKNILHSPSGESDIQIIDIKEESLDASTENGGNDDERNCTSLESADYLGLLDNDNDNNGKRYFCQRCLNHGLEFQRKGHKPTCKYATCKCELCMMVEQRRQINYQLSIRKGDDETCDSIINGRKIRRPKCARCSAHGQKQALRGHKKATCPFNQCECDMCALVENRRVLMARQIRVRRTQQRQRLQQTSETTPEPVECTSVLKRLLKPQPQIVTSSLSNDTIISKLSIQSLSKADSPPKKVLGHTKQSAFHHPTVSSVPMPKTVSTTEIASTATTTTSNERNNNNSLSQFPSVPPGLFTPAQMEFIMKLFMQASASAQQQQQPQQQHQTSHVSSTNGIPLNPFFFNHHHHQQQQHQQHPSATTILPQQFTNNNLPFFSHHLFTGFPNNLSSSSSTTSSSSSLGGGTMPSMVNPFLFSCFQGFPTTAQFSFPPFLATEQRPS